MSGDPKPEGAFDRMRQTARRKGPLSFADLSATIVDAQKKTGFVDTVSADIPPENASATASIPDADIPRGRRSATDNEGGSKPVFAELATPAQTVDPDEVTGKGKLLMSSKTVQCNLKISIDLRDALHLQALRERRTIANLVTEIMSAYLTDQGTFERLRR